MWRCVNDIFSYCATEPVWSVPPSELSAQQGLYRIPIGAFTGGICQNSPNSCPNHRSQADIIEALLRKPGSSRKRKKETTVPQAATPAPVALLVNP